jgi:hypothetical protein
VVELLRWPIIDVVLTALLVSALISLLLSLTAFFIRSVPRGSFLILFMALFAFSMLGFVTGELLGDSRDSAVGAVVPAVLTLFGTVAAYIIGSRGVRSQTAVSACLICFVFCLLSGDLFGIQLRNQYEDYMQNPGYLGTRELALERTNAALEVERLTDYVRWLQLRKLYEGQDNLDLSKFETDYEGKPAERALQSQAAPTTAAAAPSVAPAKK